MSPASKIAGNDWVRSPRRAFAYQPIFENPQRRNPAPVQRRNFRSRDCFQRSSRAAPPANAVMIWR
ncbi:MAG TPA: hypothetical protein VHN82_07605 [Methanoregula sp.]|nr:hypothetical protein [Methanoregula sp.]